MKMSYIIHTSRKEKDCTEGFVIVRDCIKACYRLKPLYLYETEVFGSIIPHCCNDFRKTCFNVSHSPVKLF